TQFFIDLPECLGTPVVLVVDDVQWLDSGSEEILRMISGASPGPRGLIATTARNDPAAAAGRDRLVEGPQLKERPRTRLSPLDLDAVGKLVGAHLGGGAELPPALIERLARVTNGNPFAIGEFVRAMLDGGVLQPHRDGWKVDGERFNQ